MFFFTIFTCVVFWFNTAKRNQFYKKAKDRSLFRNNQVAATGCAAYTYYGSFDDDFIQIQECHIRIQNLKYSKLFQKKWDEYGWLGMSEWKLGRRDDH